LVETLWFDKSLLIWIGNFNKNYRLLVERLHGRRALENMTSGNYPRFPENLAAHDPLELSSQGNKDFQI